MSKTKKILIALMLLIAVLLLPNMVNATAEYTRVISGNDGSITLYLTGLELDTTKMHEFALVISGDTPSTWHTITEKTETTATVELNSTTGDILSVLKGADTGYLYIREKDNTEEYEVNNLEVDLKLPYLNAVDVSKTSNGYEVRTLYGYNIGSMSFNWEKITDATVIEKYLAYKNNGTEISGSDLKKTVPASGFSTDWGFVATRHCTLYKHDLPKDGLYYLWIKSPDNNCKTIYGYILHDGLPNATTLEEYIGVVNGAPTVESVSASTSNYSGETIETYNYIATAGTSYDEVKITVKFDQDVVVNEKPTLKIKFGTGEEISVTEGTVSAKAITYKYKVTATDKGVLQVLDLSGGNVTNNQGTAAVLALPEFTSKVVAIEASETPEEPGNANNDGNNNSNQGNVEVPDTDKNKPTKDDTTSKDKLPDTGRVLLFWIIGIVAISATVAHIRYKKLYM